MVNGTNVTTCTNGTDNNTSGGGTKKNDTDSEPNIEGFNLNDIDPTFGIFEKLPGLKKLLTFSGPLNFT